MRRDAFSRELMREHRLSAGNFILPVFVIDGHNLVQDIPSMPGVQRMTSTLVMKRIVHERPLPG